MHSQCWPDEPRTSLPVLRQTLLPGELLWEQGKPSTDLFMVRYGALKLVTLLSNGEEHLRAFVLRGELIGHEAMAGQTRHSRAEVLEETAVCRIHWPLNEMPLAALAPGLLRRLATLLLQAEDTRQPEDDPRRALLRYLTALRRRIGVPDGACGGQQLRLPMSRADLASYLGFAEGTVCRTLRALAREGQLKVRGRTVWLPAAPAAGSAAAPSNQRG